MYCIVVKRGDYQQYDVLYKAFGARLPVIWDRRRLGDPERDPPSRAGMNEPDRRYEIPSSWVALGFVVARH